MPGRIIAAGQFDQQPLHMVWESLDRRSAYCVYARFEGIYWMCGSGLEVDGALLAAYALAGGRGPDALTGEL